MSAPTNTAITPGIAAASVVSIDAIRKPLRFARDAYAFPGPKTLSTCGMDAVP